ncbi:MAG: ribonuclease R [bacterium]|nr:ribonuclease R [bacterium]
MKQHQNTRKTTTHTSTPKNKNKDLSGIISLSSKGTGYVTIDGYKEDIEIDYKHLNRALHGDTVEIILHPQKNSRLTGEVKNIITRAKNGFAGVIEKDNNIHFFKPDDNKVYTDFLISQDNLSDAKVGQKVFVEIISWIDKNKMPEGNVVKIFGEKGHNDTEMHAIAMERGFDNSFPTKVEEEAHQIQLRGIKEADFKNRRDFRDTVTFTIDPIDAKDFDDAISFKEIPNNEYEIGIHIADVSHYVKVDSELDREARKSTTSVYLVDRTIPMLPEELSNDLCSLVPNKDRLTMSAVFNIKKDGTVTKEWYGKTIIHSKTRFSYEKAEESIKHKDKPLHKELYILNTIAKKLHKDRFDAGAISLEQDEVKFILDNTGVPIKVLKKTRGDSNKLIEEFMLLANRKVAEYVSKKTKNFFIYRIHDLPNKEKTEDLTYLLKSLGYKIHIKNGCIPSKELNNILSSLAGKSLEDTVQRIVIRSMAKAIYSTKNIGHYGLAFKYYTHFTSPIRRYPDIIVHRILNDVLNGKKIEERNHKIYQEICIKSSEQEKRASEAERASIKYKQVEYMGKRIGEVYKGIISGVSEWGIYVEEIETKCEGLVRVRDMDDDFYVLNEKKLELVGKRKKNIYKLGGKVKMKVKSVDLEKKTIDYILV